MKIAVDLGAYSLSDGGIARYVGCMMEAMQGAEPMQHDWLLYGRGAAFRKFSNMPGVTLRADGLPQNAGRIASLVTSLPYWCARDRPEVFWGPAHRLPVRLPKSTASVVTIHDLCWLKAPDTMRAVTRRLDATLMPRAIRQADKIIAVSTATAEDLASAFPHAVSKIVVIPEGVSPLPAPRAFETLQAINIRVPFVLFVGTLEPRKNLHRLLDAFAAVQREQGAAPAFAIAGGTGWGAQALEEKCRALSLGDKVKILGRVDDQTLSTLYQHALCLAMPSLYEGFGLPLVEAMSVGTPVLTSNVSSMPEVAGPAGVLVDPLSTESIAKGLSDMINNAPLRAQKAAAAIQQARLFSWTRSAEATLETLRHAANEK